MDDATAELITQLQLEDARAVLEQAKAGNDFHDSTAVFELQVEELERAHTAMKDRRLCQSIAQAVSADGAMVNEMSTQERRATEDRLHAQALEDDELTPDTAGEDVHADDDMGSVGAFAHFLALNQIDSCVSGVVLGYVDKDCTVEIQQYFQYRSQNEDKAHATCQACSEEVRCDHMVQNGCSHWFCHSCVFRVFKMATDSQDVYPPQCCQQRLSLTEARKILGDQLMDAFMKKAEEYETPDRMYCPDGECGSFVSPRWYGIGTNATCPKCALKICKKCKRKAHEGSCDEDQDKEMLEALQKAGYQRCARCRYMIELKHGCDHITCRCGYQFCYNCGAKWQTCRCSLWHPGRLMEQRAHQPEL